MLLAREEARLSNVASAILNRKPGRENRRQPGDEASRTKAATRSDRGISRLPECSLYRPKLNQENFPVKSFLFPIAAATCLLTVSLAGPPANAKGCIKGAVVGGVAGHFAGHHGLLGAAGGCAIGHHMANNQAQQQSKQGSGSSPTNSNSGH
jgi:hypothetical protein